MRDLQRFFRRELFVLPIADHVPGSRIVRGTVFGRLLSGLTVRQLRHVPTVPAPLHRMRVAHELHDVSLAVAVADRPVSNDMRTWVSDTHATYIGEFYEFFLLGGGDRLGK